MKITWSARNYWLAGIAAALLPAAVHAGVLSLTLGISTNCPYGGIAE